jgi:hypothetical protein
MQESFTEQFRRTAKLGAAHDPQLSAAPGGHDGCQADIDAAPMLTTGPIEPPPVKKMLSQAANNRLETLKSARE